MKVSNKVNIAYKILLHEKKRLALSILAVSFAVLVIFMQLGFFTGMTDSQANLFAKLNADLVIMNAKQIHLNKWDTMSRSTLYQTLGNEGVTEVVPMYKHVVNMKNPQTGVVNQVLLLAFPPDSDPLDIPLYKDNKETLKRQGAVLFDKKSRKIMGKVEIGQEIELDEKKYRVSGFVKLGTNLSFDGNILMSEGTWLRDKNVFYADNISLGLLRVRPGTDIQALKKKVLGTVTEEVTLLTPDELRKREVVYTVKTAPVGSIFGVGLIIGFIIGIIICYQILYNEITDHLPQFATLKAMGFNDKFLIKIVFQQTVLLSLIGFIPGVFLSSILYIVLTKITGIAMYFTFNRLTIVFIMTLAMCVSAGLIAVKKLIRADPAELF